VQVVLVHIGLSEKSLFLIGRKSLAFCCINHSCVLFRLWLVLLSLSYGLFDFFRIDVFCEYAIVDQNFE
jgi:hypothetical protein